MASMAVYLRYRPRSLLRASAPPCSSSSPSLLLSSSSFSSSSSSDPDDAKSQTPNNTQNDSRFSDSFSALKSRLNQAERKLSHQPPENAQNNSRFSFSFSDLKSHLKQVERQPPQQPPRKPFSFSQGANSSLNKPTAGIDEIRKSLSEFRNRSAAPAPPPPSQGQPISLQQLYKKNVTENAGQSGSIHGDKAAKTSFASIRESLQGLKTTQREGLKIGTLSRLKDSFNYKPSAEERGASGRTVVGGTTVNLPLNVFGKEMEEKSKKDGESKEDELKNDLVKEYSYGELGEKLRKLRPEGAKKGENWFSLSELNERLIRLRKVEKEDELRTGGASFNELRRTIQTMHLSDAEKNRKTTHQRLDILGQLGGTQSYMLSPPKEHLVEKYFHPDNMSSAEKLKLELKRVRDEFKMSETDCGSARVQIAQLTTEINHLGKVLHKKDKHSRKGLQAKVQMRKKLLKYLRRTDWDSYCFILSKLGLRDNPGYKQ